MKDNVAAPTKTMKISTNQIIVGIVISTVGVLANQFVMSGRSWLMLTQRFSTNASAKPWWSGVPTKLIKKTTMVEAGPDRLPVYTLTFAIPNGDTLTGRAMPHDNVRIDLGDVVKMVIPNYKPKSYSMSALRDGEFDVTFKVYPNGRASGFLDRLKVGEEMNTFGMSPKRVRNPGDYVGLIAYGVGITEAFPVAIAELEKGDAKKVVLLWASRTEEDTFWNDEMEAIVKKYPSKFELVHILSRQKKDDCLYGRINPDVLNQVFKPTQRDSARFLSVGTKEMMKMTENMLQSIGYSMPTQLLLSH